MLFIVLLALVTSAIAGAAAYFSVYGLAYTFSGVFWSVVVMGASLEAGKLIAASFLYRYWNKTGVLLKSYLISGVLALMVLTSSGIFGYLSTGYQQDVLPLKQKTEQVQLLEEEKARALARKRQIDDLLVGNTNATNTTSTDARSLNAASRNRDSLNRQYRDEQKSVTTRVTELDKQLLDLKQDVIKTEAHIGPITYVAKAFNLATDDATKYLIFLIIFSFDPMAVALTLCVNMAIKWKKDDEDAKKAEFYNEPDDDIRVLPMHLATVQPPAEPEPYPIVERPKVEDEFPEVVEEQPVEVLGWEVPDDDWEDTIVEERELELEPIEDSEHIDLELNEPQQELDFNQPADIAVDPTVLDAWYKPAAPEPIEPPPLPPEQTHSVSKPEIEEVAEPPTHSVSKGTPLPYLDSNFRPASWLATANWADDSAGKLTELMTHLRYLRAKVADGFELTNDEQREMHKIEEVLRRNGYDKYL